MIERQLILYSRGGGIDVIETPIDISNLPLVKHKQLVLPPLCPRYAHLPLTENWFLELQAHQQGKKRLHRKSHGLIPFRELAQMVSKNYREIDDETREFIYEVTGQLGWHCDEIEAIEKEMADRENPSVVASMASVGGGKALVRVVSSTGNSGTSSEKAVVATSEAKASYAKAANRGPLKKRKLSHGEAATAHQLIDVKAQSPSALAFRSTHNLVGHTQAYSQATSPVPSESDALGHISEARLETKLRIELKMQRLKDEMSLMHQANTEQENQLCPQDHPQARDSFRDILQSGYEQHFSLFGGSTTPPFSSHMPPCPGSGAPHSR